MVKIRNVCMLVNDNLYNSKRYFSHRLQEALERQGVHCEILDIGGGTLETKEIAHIQKLNPDMMLSFSTVACLPDRTFIWDHLHIPHLFILVDPAIYYLDFVRSKYVMISCVDHFDCEILRKAKFQYSFFLPHGVETEMLDPPLEGQRPYDIVMIGSCYDHEGLRQSWRKNLPKPVSKVIEEAIEISLSEPKTHFTEALVRAWDESKLDYTGVNFLNLCAYIDNYLRGKDRVELIRSIRDAEIHIFGGLYWDEEGRMKEWKDYVGDQKNVVIHNPVSFEEVFFILQKSKICLNSTPFFKNGSHERVFNSLACGCCVIASENEYLREHFSEEDGIAFYRSKHWDEVNSMISTWLSDESLRLESASSGRDLVMRGHTWENRAQTILEKVPPMIEEIISQV